MKHKPIDKLMLILVAALVLVLAVLNIGQTDRPTFSESENRNLAKWPEFKIADVASGKYFSDISAFFSDTFFGREVLVNFSKELDNLKGFFDEDFSIIINPNPTDATEPEEDETLPTLPPLPPVTQPTVPPTQPPTEPGPTEPGGPTKPVIPILLSDTNLTVMVGASKTLTATVGEGFSNLTWTAEDAKIATVKDNGDGTASVKGVKAGTTSISATVENAAGEKFSFLCIITVKAVEQQTPTGDAADFLPNGLFIYKGAAYTQSYFNKTYSTKLGEIFERFALLFPNSRVSLVTAPLATITITDPDVSKKVSDQGAILDKIEAVMPDSVNFVNLKEIFLAHADEYLYLKSDHHWNQRGAYYAYYAFAQSVGLTPTPLDRFEVKILNTKYIGSMYNYTKDERVKSFYDTVEAFIPTKACTLTIHKNGKTTTHDTCINLKNGGYTSFIYGDNGYTVINVPENPQDMTALVFKDSYGNAMVPFLTEHYGNIIVVDARYIDLDAVESFGDMNITDIIFLNNTSSMTKSWYQKYYKMVD